jgi:hypothetical protein
MTDPEHIRHLTESIVELHLQREAAFADGDFTASIAATVEKTRLRADLQKIDKDALEKSDARSDMRRG